MAFARAVCQVVIVLVATTPAVSQEVEVLLLDGRRVEGTAMSWDKAGVRVADKGGESVMLDDAQILRVELESTKAEDLSPAEFWLTDGSQIRARGISIASEVASIERVESNGSDDKAWSIPLNQIVAARLQTADDVAAAERRDILSQWQQLLSEDRVADALVIRKVGKATLQPVEGVIESVAEDTVRFSLNDEAIDVNRDRVFGLIYYRGKSEPASSGVIAVTKDGSELFAESVLLQGDTMQVNRAGGQALSVPVDSIAHVDYSPGRLAYLSDIDPHRVELSPPIVEPDGVILQWWQPRRDRGFSGRGLVLAFPPDEEGPAGRLPKLQNYSKGLAIRGPATVVYRLPSGYRRLVATVGVDPKLPSAVPVQFLWKANGQTLATGSLDRATPPIELEVDIEGVREITLVVQPVAGDESASPARSSTLLPAGPLVIQFCDARLLK